MISIKETSTHIKQMKEEFKIVEIKKSEIVDFCASDTQGLKIIFMVKGKFNMNKCVVMRFCNVLDFDLAIEQVIAITDKLGV